jgi:hypothetical protein
MNILEKDLGKALSSQEVAVYFECDVKTVRKYYRDLGGIRLGRHYRFFEKEIYNAIQKRSAMDCSSEEGREEAEQGISNEKGSYRVGNEDAAKTRRRLGGEDRHNIFG